MKEPSLAAMRHQLLQIQKTLKVFAGICPLLLEISWHRETASTRQSLVPSIMVLQLFVLPDVVKIGAFICFVLDRAPVLHYNSRVTRVATIAG